MSDNRGLVGKLRRLAASDSAISDGWRQVDGDRDSDQLAAILREIDETQLPRALSFRNESGQVLHLEAGNRRLLKVLTAGGSDQGALDALAKKDLSKLNDDETDALARMFRAFQPGDQKIWVRSENPPAERESSRNGLSVTKLARALSIDPDICSDENLRRAFEDFVNEQMSDSKDWARFENGEVMEQSRTLPAAGWRESRRFPDLTQIEYSGAPFENTPTLSISGSGVEQDPHHVFAMYGTTHVLLIIDSANLSKIAQRWRDLGL